MQTILEEIQSVKSFTSNRAGVSEKVINGLVSSIIKQIHGLKTIGPQDATLLSDALKDSPYGEAGTATINASIDAALSKTISTAVPSPNESKQFFKTWWSACTPTDWRTFRSNVPWSAKLTCLVERANSIGCTDPDEQCFKWMLAMLLCACYSELPSPRERYNKLQELKKCADTEKKSYPYDHLLIYPPNINDLPQHMWQHAYAAEAPLVVELPGVNLVADRIPLRSNAKLLKDSPSADQAARAVVGNSHAHIPKGHDIPALAASSNAGQHVAANVPQAASQGIVLNDNDPEEVALHAKFQADLWKIRATKLGLLGTSPPKTKQEPLTIKKEADGSFVVGQTCTGEPGAADHTGHIGYKPKNNNLDQAVGVEVDLHGDQDKVAGDQDKAAGHESALDPFSQAALKALQKRNAQKRKNSAGKKHGLKKKPASAVVCEVAHAGKSSTASMPPDTPDGSNPSPVPYLKGVIYTEQNHKKFRALKIKGDKNTESSSTWGTKRTKDEAWGIVTRAIRSHSKGA